MNIKTPIPYIPYNNSPLEKNSTAAPGNEHGTFRSVGNIVTTGPSELAKKKPLYRVIGVFFNTYKYLETRVFIFQIFSSISRLLNIWSTADLLLWIPPLILSYNFISIWNHLHLKWSKLKFRVEQVWSSLYHMNITPSEPRNEYVVLGKWMQHVFERPTKCTSACHCYYITITPSQVLLEETLSYSKITNLLSMEPWAAAKKALG